MELFCWRPQETHFRDTTQIPDFVSIPDLVLHEI